MPISRAPVSPVALTQINATAHINELSAERDRLRTVLRAVVGQLRDLQNSNRIEGLIADLDTLLRETGA